MSRDCVREFVIGKAVAVAKSSKNGPCVCERGENLLQNGILNFTFRLNFTFKSIVRNRVGKLEFTLLKTDFFERGSSLAEFNFAKITYQIFV